MCCPTTRVAAVWLCALGTGCGEKEDDTAAEVGECVESGLCEAWVEAATTCNGGVPPHGMDDSPCQLEWRFQPTWDPWFECQIDGTVELDCDFNAINEACSDLYIVPSSAELQQSFVCACRAGYDGFESSCSSEP